MRANNQNLLEAIKNIPHTIISKIISHNFARPKKTPDGIVVINAIGMKILKNILNVKEKEFNGNLPM